MKSRHRRLGLSPTRKRHTYFKPCSIAHPADPRSGPNARATHLFATLHATRTPLPAAGFDLRPGRSGAVMVFVLIALLVASIIVAATIRTTGMSFRQLKRDEIRLQAALLVDAGHQRALVRWREDSSFSGERWKIEDGQLGPDRPAIVTTTVEATETDPREMRITAIAELPLGHPDQVRLTRTWSMKTDSKPTE